jgi:hypothetical protein
MAQDHHRALPWGQLLQRGHQGLAQGDPGSRVATADTRHGGPLVDLRVVRTHLPDPGCQPPPAVGRQVGQHPACICLRRAVEA